MVRNYGIFWNYGTFLNYPVHGSFVFNLLHYITYRYINKSINSNGIL